MRDGSGFRPTIDESGEGELLSPELANGVEEGEPVVDEEKKLGEIPLEVEVSVEDQRERLAQLERDMAVLLVSIDQIGNALQIDIVQFLAEGDATQLSQLIEESVSIGELVDLHNAIDPDCVVDIDLVGVEGEVLLRRSIGEEIVSLCKSYQSLYEEIATLRQSLGLEGEKEKVEENKEDEDKEGEEDIDDDDDNYDELDEEGVSGTSQEDTGNPKIVDLEEEDDGEGDEIEDEEEAEFEVAGTVVTEDEEVVQHWGDLIKLGIFRGSVNDTGDGKYVLKHDILPPSMSWLTADRKTFFESNNEFYRRNPNAFDNIPNPYIQFRKGAKGKENYIPKEVFLDASGRAMRFFSENRWEEFEKGGLNLDNFRFVTRHT